MSLFPQPDKHKMRGSGLTWTHPFFNSSSTSSESSRVPDAFNMVDLSNHGRFIPAQDASQWAMQDPRSMGVMSIPHSMDGRYDAMTTAVDVAAVSAQQPLNMAYSWPTGEYEMSQVPTTQADCDMFRRDSWNDAGHSMSSYPVRSDAASWDSTQLPIASSTYEISSGEPSYTSSTRTSIVSSPNAVSDHGMTSMGSPVVKVEDGIDPSTSRLQYYQPVSEYDPSMQSRSNDLYVAYGQLDRYAGSSVSHNSGYAGDARDEKFVMRRDACRESSSSDDAKSDMANNRKKRSFTSAENASCACTACGKMFQRSYNLKAHMETHDPHRHQPHECQYPDCDKKFVRKTDLDRHEKSVHVKTRDYACPYCTSRFSRKDTLRRHVEDGCSRRPEFKRRAPSAKNRRSTLTKASRRKGCS